MLYHVIYDGNCNLCVTLVQLLEKLDTAQRFNYIPMQDENLLDQFGITPEICEQGMILIDIDRPEKRWQGSDAAEEIGRILPMGKIFIDIYRSLPGLKWAGDRIYAQIRDNRYLLFGKRATTYQPICNSCDNYFQIK